MLWALAFHFTWELNGDTLLLAAFVGSLVGLAAFAVYEAISQRRRRGR